MALSEQMCEALNKYFKWKLTNVPDLDPPVLVIFDYSPAPHQPIVSIAFDFSGGAKCWLTATNVRHENGDGPSSHPDYREFTLDARKFHPYSITPLQSDLFTDIRILKKICRSMYAYILWD